MARTGQHERNRPITVRPEPLGYAQESLVEGLTQKFPNKTFNQPIHPDTFLHPAPPYNPHLLR